MPDPETQRRIEALEARVRRLEAQLARAQPPSSPAEDWLPAEPAPSAPVPRQQVPRAAPPLAPLPPATPPPSRQRSQTLEKLLGGNWLARAGVLVLALGVLFFLKLAYDNNWVPLWGRIAIGVLGGLALFATGELLRQRRFDSTFSQIVAGGGALIAYATLYAAYALPNYRAALGLTVPVEVGLLAAMSALLGAYALWRDLPVLAGVAVGLCALLVAPAGDFSAVGVLFLGLLGASLLAAAAWRGWSAVVLTSIVGLNVAHLAAATNAAVPWWLTLGSAVVVDTLAVLAAARSKAPDPALSRLEAGLAAALLFAVGAVALAAGGIQDAMAWSALVVGLAAAFACIPLRRVAPGLGIVGGALLLSWPLHLSGLEQPLAWAGLGAAALAASLVGPAARWLRVEAAAAVTAGTLALFSQAEIHDAARLHPLASGALALVLLGVAAATWVAGRREGKDPGGSWLGFGAACALLLIWPFLQFPGSLLQTATLLLSGTLLCGLGLAWAAGRSEVRMAAAGLAAVGVASLFLLAASHHVARLEPYGAGGLALALFGLAFAVWMDGRRGVATDPAGQVGLVMGAVLAAVWPFFQFPNDLWQTVTFGGIGLALLGGSLLWPAVRTALRVGATGAAGLGLLSLFALGAVGAVRSSPLKSLAAAGLLLGVACALWAANRSGRRDAVLGRAALALASLVPLVELGFLLAGWHITVSWALEALVVVVAGLLLKDADVRIASLGLFGVVVGRIFLLDLRELPLPARVVAFLLTGGLLLLGSFLYARQRRSDPPPEATPSAPGRP